jgi:hypothetical protein
VLELLLLIVRAIGLACRGRRELVLENIALSHQLRTLQLSVKRPHLRHHDRMFWVLLASVWPRWRSALVLVQPKTVLRWHRDWLRRRWARRSGRNRAGRPPLDPALRRLIVEMATANPLWGAPRIHGELRKLGMQVSEPYRGYWRVCLDRRPKRGGRSSRTTPRPLHPWISSSSRR